MISIYKYELKIEDYQTLSVPRCWVPLSVQFQDGKLCLWAKVNTYNTIENRGIRIFETGHPVENIEGMKFIGTVQKDSMVWHVFVE